MKLRNIGGVIVVDFIDMESRRDQFQLLEHFTSAIKDDSARPQIAQLTELGLVELTRKRQGQNIYELFGQKCSTCDGTGHVENILNQEISNIKIKNIENKSNQSKNADPAAVVFDAINSAKKRNIDLLLVDTAGRLQTKNNLMDELAKIKKIIDKKVPDAIVESLLVLDASQGQNGLKQAKSFAKSADLSGAIITKLDGTSRGGGSLAVSEEGNLPIRFIGAGEGIKDLRPFNSYEFVEALLSDK